MNPLETLGKIRGEFSRGFPQTRFAWFKESLSRTANSEWGQRALGEVRKDRLRKIQWSVTVPLTDFGKKFGDLGRQTLESWYDTFRQSPHEVPETYGPNPDLDAIETYYDELFTRHLLENRIRIPDSDPRSLLAAESFSLFLAREIEQLTLAKEAYTIYLYTVDPKGNIRLNQHYLNLTNPFPDAQVVFEDRPDPRMAVLEELFYYLDPRPNLALPVKPLLCELLELHPMLIDQNMVKPLKPDTTEYEARTLYEGVNVVYGVSMKNLSYVALRIDPPQLKDAKVENLNPNVAAAQPTADIARWQL